MSKSPLFLRYSTMMIPFFTLTLVVHQSCASSPCTYSKQSGLFTADCAYKNMEEVPRNFKPETEVLNLSHNKLEYLNNNSFNCWTGVKQLYLKKNPISSVEFGTFARMTSLTVLDISITGILALPYLPNNLRKLYLNRVPQLFATGSDYSSTMQQITRLTHLETLDLSRNGLQHFPKFTMPVMHNLVYLNISGNGVSDVTADHLAGLCQLKYLYVDPLPVTDSKEEYCTCLELKYWTVKRNIELGKPPICKPSRDIKFDCDSALSNSTQEIYQQCIAVKNAEGIHRYFLFGVCGAILIIVFVLCYAYYRRTYEGIYYLNYGYNGIKDNETTEKK